MDIRSKNSKFWRILTKSWLKITAFILVCLLGTSSIAALEYTVYRDPTQGQWRTNTKYKGSTNYQQQVMDMYERLCIYSVIYLGKQEDEKFKGGSVLFDSFKNYLDWNEYEYQCSGEKLHLVSDKFYYYVSYTDKDGKIHYDTNIEDDLSSFKEQSKRISYLKRNYNNYILRENNKVSCGFTPSSENILYQPYDSSDTEYYAKNIVPVGWRYYRDGEYEFNYGNAETIRLSANSLEKDYDEDSYEEQETDSQDRQAEDDSGITVFFADNTTEAAVLAADFDKQVEEMNFAFNLSKICGLCILPFLAYLLLACGYSTNENGERTVVFRRRFDKLCTEVYSLFIILGIAVFTVILNDWFYEYKDEIQTLTSLLGNSKYMILSVAFAVSLLFFGSLAQIAVKLKKNAFISESLTHRLVEDYRQSEYYKAKQRRPAGSKLKAIAIKIIFSAALAFFLTFFLGFELGETGLTMIVLAAAGVWIIYLLAKLFSGLKDINVLSRQIDSLGKDENFTENIKETSPVYSDSKKLVDISQKVKNSVEEQIKSERMKIELVANVSHDLKTPLTSIISYIDLLKKQELDAESAAYVKVLDRKSQKLKGIVSDVFSLAKATSGIDVNLVRLDFVMLFNQVMADCQDKIDSCGKKIIVDISEENAFIQGDGDKLYRVWQNLLDNAVNYSMEKTRIFINIYKEQDNIVMVTKNISASPITFTAEEITERFVRGDKSRTDGGSGLGLSIAKSFTEVCGGSFRIELEGDMFKTYVEFPLDNKNEKEDI